MSRNPAKDQIAIVGMGRAGYQRSVPGRTAESLALEAATLAIRDAGLSASDVDALCGGGIPGVQATSLGSGLGIGGVTYWMNPTAVIGFALANACNAVYSGQSEIALVYYSVQRTPFNSSSAFNDPYRRRAMEITVPAGRVGYPELNMGAIGYASWASRYIADYGLKREQLGKVALSDRSNASRNPYAAMKEPLTMDDYLNARMVRAPLSMLDMDVPIDAADAFVVTTAERARDLPQTPVLLHAMSFGLTDRPEEDQQVDLFHTGQQVALRGLWSRSDLALDDVDVYFPYDGFSIITINWIENVGFCAKGEGGEFLDSNWDAASQSIRIGGRVAVNPHGGALSEGATQGAGHLAEAVAQLRRSAGDRQVDGANTALITPGGFFMNSQAMLLRKDEG